MNFRALAAGIVLTATLTGAAWADGYATEADSFENYHESASAPARENEEREAEYRYEESERRYEDAELQEPLPDISPLDEFFMKSYHTNDVTQVTTVWDNCSDKDDVAVTLYLSELSGVSAVDINLARRSGRHWQEIINELDINRKAVLPEFQSIKITKSNLNKALPVRILQNWAADSDKYELYDKTLRQLCNAELLMRHIGIAPLDAALRTEKYSYEKDGQQHYFGAVEEIIPE